MRPDGATHEFPDTHIDYEVPPDRADEVIEFDGSVTVRRTRGELSAECHGEPANFLAINLTHDVLAGDKIVEEPGSSTPRFTSGRMPATSPDTSGSWTSTCPEGDQADPDETILAEEHEATVREDAED